MADESNTRPSSQHPCIYWQGAHCGATDIYSAEDISCWNAGNCDGFGTCRGCSKYNQGGLKFNSSDGNDGHSQLPMNLQLYNIRAQVKPCCFWDADPVEFEHLSGPSPTKTTVCAEEEIDDPNSLDPLTPDKIKVLTVLSGDTSLFPSTSSLLATKEGATSFTISYSGKEIGYFKDYVGIPVDVVGTLSSYKLSMVTREAVPHFLSKTDPEEPDPDLNTERTSCTLDAAAPWQSAFTDDNPSAYGCNGAKSECPFYTGPKFTELVDKKMDTGNRISAKQVLELRFHSTDWASSDNPREQYEQSFKNPDIWAWVSTSTVNTHPDIVSGQTVGHLPGSGRKDTDGNPMVQKVSIEDLTADTPKFIVGSPEPVTAGTAVQGGVPSFPDLVKELGSAATGMEVLWPRRTTEEDPFVRKVFSAAEMNMWISVQANSDRDVVAINLTKHPQDGDTDSDFVSRIRQLHPEDVIFDIQSGLPALTFAVPLVLSGNRETLNHIKIFLENTSEDGSMLTADVYIHHVFYHAEVAQTRFRDNYGHTMIDPWVNHFSDIEVSAKFLHLTNNTKVHDVLWNTFVSNGKVTLYATEQVEEVSSDSSEDNITWEQIGCGAIAVTFTDPNINRVYPWRAWGSSTKGSELYVKIDRSGNSALEEEEPKEVKLELLFASSKGTAIPGNVAIFGLPAGQRIRTLDHKVDIIRAKYAYTKYKQGPITEEDKDGQLLKFPSDVVKVIETNAYETDFDDNSMRVAGTFVKVGTRSAPGGNFSYKKIYSCDQVIGKCYTDKALENEKLARTVFMAGGIGEAGIKTAGDLQNECRQEFDNNYLGLEFEDGTKVTLSEVVNRLSKIHLSEGSQHYNVVFSDEDGRPIGSKTVGFLTQSAVVQNRDVEIKYKWGAHMRHFPTVPRMLVHAIFHEPTFSTRDRLIKVIYEYDPNCGDHTETTIGRTTFTAFDLETDKHGALWYPYKQCVKPRYHLAADEWLGPVSYTDTVEGFSENKRRDYWERMRFFDEYTPAILNFWGQIGCFFGEYTTTANAHPSVMFTGYTKIRSDHAFGPYATDRESLRVSRHWEKRNLTINEETLKQEDDGFTVSISDEFAAILYDEDGKLIEGQGVQTPVWVHINDGFSVVTVASEKISHPFSRYLLREVGDYTHSESFNEDRLPLADVFVDRDFTSTSQRAEDGSKVYVPDSTIANTAEGDLEVSDGSDVRWVFVGADQTWAWLSQPPTPLRAQVSNTSEDESPTEQITGLTLSTVGPTFFKKNKRSATHTTEGKHEISYTPHTFDSVGSIATPATLSMDGGPEWNISQTTGAIYVITGSPYLAEEHADEDYKFRLHGHGPGGAGLLADSRGLQHYEVNDIKYSTYAGVNITTLYDINELPYDTVNITQLSRLSSAQEIIDDFTVEYTAEDLSPKSLSFDFKGHYYVEKVIIDWEYGGGFDVPVIDVTGSIKSLGVASGPSAVTEVVSLVDPTAYKNAAVNIPVVNYRQTTLIKQRLFNLHINVGARKRGRKAKVTKVQVLLRENTTVTEVVFIYEPRAQVSTASVGTHKPSDLEFYFQREVPDFAKSYQSGQIALATLGPGDYSVTQIPGVEVKYTGRQIKDIIPMFNFTAFEGFFPYKNIDLTKINNYTEETSPAGQTLRYINTPVSTSSKGWTMKTSRHYSDPSVSDFSTDSGPEGFPNVSDANVDLYNPPNVSLGNKPNEELQGFLYSSASNMLQGHVAQYDSFWHPEEKDFFLEKAGIDLTESKWNWELILESTVAPIENVFKHESYGCALEVTNENLDGEVHVIDNWQAKGVFHYLCDPRYSWACLAVVMNKCNEFMFRDYGKDSYLTNDIVDRFTYKFQFPPSESQLYKDAGLYNQNEIGGFIGGTGGVGVSQVAAPYPRMSQLQQTFQSELDVTGTQQYQ